MAVSVLKQVILPSIFEVKAKAEKKKKDVSLPDILQHCLQTAGFSTNGSEALQLHFHMFTSCFQPGHDQDSLAESKNDEGSRFTTDDYFLAVVDKNLQWFSSYLELLPYLRLPVIVQVVTQLLFYFDKRMKEGIITNMDICLQVSGLEMFCIAVIDILAGRNVKVEDSIDARMEKLVIQMKELSMLLESCLSSTTSLLKNEEILSALNTDPPALQYVIDKLSVFLILLDPCKSVLDVMHFMKETLPERYWKDCNENPLQHLSMKEILNLSANLDCGKNCVSVSTIDSVESKQKKQLIEGVLLPPEDSGNKVETNASFAVSHGRKYIILENLLRNLQNSFGQNLIIDATSFLVSCDRGVLASELTLNKNSVKIGHYLLNRQMVSSHLKSMSLMSQDMAVKGSQENMLLTSDFVRKSEEEFIENSEMDTENKEKEKLLKLFTTADLRESLKLVRKAVNDRESAWLELLSLGLKKTDVENWWNCGFYDLVWKNLDWLANETNAKSVLDVLCHLSCQQPVNKVNVNSMTLLFMAMFDKLRLLIQEHLIITSRRPVTRTLEEDKSIVDEPFLPEKHKMEEGDPLANLKTKTQVLKELTPILNKLTVGRAREIASDVLKLCLYQSRAVLSQMLQVTIRNTGQILPIVELLRQIPNMSTRHLPGSNMSELTRCLLDVLCGASLDEKETENVITLTMHLTTEYTQVVDLKRNLTRKRPSILSINQTLLHLIYPGLDKGLNQEYHSDAGTVLSASVSLSCLTSVIQTIKMDQVDPMEYLVLINTAIEMYTRNFTISCNGLGGDDEKQQRQCLSVKQKSFTCLEVLIEKACANTSYFPESAIQSFVDRISRLGLLPVALCYPFLRSTCHFQMSPFLKALIEEEIQTGSRNVFQAVVRLLQLGLANELTCQDVCQVFKRMEGNVTLKQLTAIIAHVLSQSLPCQMSRLYQMTVALIGRMEVEKHCRLCLKGYTMAKDAEIYIVCVETLYDGLLVLHARHKSNALLQRHFVANFQAAIQGLLSNINHQEDVPELHYRLFQLCCLVMSVFDSAACQGLNALALTTINQWSCWLRQRKGHHSIIIAHKNKDAVTEACGESVSSFSSPSEERVSVTCEDRHDGISLKQVGLSAVETDGEIVSSSSLSIPNGRVSVTLKEKDQVEDGRTSNISSQRGWREEDLLTLKDSVVSLPDEDMRVQLLKQIESVQDVFS